MKRPALFTEAEQAFLAVLDEALGPNYRVLGQVRLADVIDVKDGLDTPLRQRARSRIQGKTEVSAGIAPGEAQINSFSAIGSKSARKCTELLLTRIFCSVGSMPT